MTFCKAQQDLLDAPLEVVFYGGALGGGKSQAAKIYKEAMEAAGKIVHMSKLNDVTHMWIDEACDVVLSENEIKRNLGIELHEAAMSGEYEGNFKENR